MDSSKERASAWRRGSKTTGGLCLGLVVSLGIVGCADHRVSLSEFLDMQQAATAEQHQAAQEPPAPDLGAKLGPFKVGPDDVLAIHLTGANGAPLFPAPVQVRIDRKGEIELPVVGDIKVASMELQDVEDTIHRSYVPGVYTEAVCHVELISADTTNVLVTGAVTLPGLVPLRRTECNMLYAIVGAGGVSELASGRATLRRIRRPVEEVTLDLTDPVHLGAARSNRSSLETSCTCTRLNRTRSSLVAS